MFITRKADFYKGINPSALRSYPYEATTVRRYLVPTALRASGSRIPAAVVVAVVVVVIIAAEGAAAAFRPEVAPVASDPKARAL